MVLPSDISELATRFDVIEKPVSVPMYDFMWSYVAEEGREKLLVQQAFALPISSAALARIMPQTPAYPCERAHVGDVALKMTLVTPTEHYDTDQATYLLKSAGQEAVDIAVKALLERGVVSKVVRDPKKSKPGRLLKISDQ